MDVAIVGGGPSGLAAAVAIGRANPRLRVEVFERQERLHKQGTRVVLAPNGKNAIRAIYPPLLHRIEQDFLELREGISFDFATRKQMTFPLPSDSNTAVWQCVMRALGEFLPEDCIRTKHMLEDVRQEDQGASLKFKGMEARIKAKLVIGCDGGFSVVRRCMLGDGMPDFLNKVAWQGVLDWPRDWPYRKDQKFYGGSSIVGIAAAVDVDRLGWQLFAPWSDDDLDEINPTRTDPHGTSGTLIKRRCLDSIKRLPDFLVKAVENTDANNLSEEGLFARSPESCEVWCSGSLALLGDAAHLFNLEGGQGYNQALMDAVELGRAIGELGATNEALKKYEKVRAASCKYVHQGLSRIKDGEISERRWHRDYSQCRNADSAPLVQEC